MAAVSVLSSPQVEQKPSELLGRTLRKMRTFITNCRQREAIALNPKMHKII